MRTLIFIALAAACAAVPASGQSGSQAASSSVQVPGTQSPRYLMNADEFKDFSGRYVLSNGKTMRVWRERKALFAQVEGEPRLDIIPVAMNQFLVRATGARITFDLAYGNLTGNLAISAPPLPPALRLGAR